MLRPIALVLLALGMSARLAGPASADAAPIGSDRPIDESALRYYAAQGQKDRVAAEARRLSGIRPDWRLPDDLYAAKPGRADEGPLWALYGQQRFDALKAAITAREGAEPGWHPSADLENKINQVTWRAAVKTRAQAGDWRGIVQTMKATGLAWAREDAEALWIIGEAYARGDDCAEAFISYRMVLTDHTAANERTATIERAIATLPMLYVEKLIAMGHRLPDGGGEFDSIAIDITRARIGAYLHDEVTTAVEPDHLAAFEQWVRRDDRPDQSGMVAWYAFKQHDYPTALEWFKRSIGHGGDAMIAHGLALTLRKLGMTRDAEEVAYAWRDPLVNNVILFVDIVGTALTAEHPARLGADRIARYARVVAGTESGEGAQALAWYAYNTCDDQQALEWFQRAMAWMPKETTVEGYALTLRRLKRTKEFREIVNRYDGLFPKVANLIAGDMAEGPQSPCEAGRPGLSTARHDDQQGDRDIGRSRVPFPEAAAVTRMPHRSNFKTSDFPIAVWPENPLRFSPLATIASEDQASRGPPKAPRVARRVPGVAVMPYERYGLALLPGWDGTLEASAPLALDHAAPMEAPDAAAAVESRDPPQTNRQSGLDGAKGVAINNGEAL